MAAKVSLRAKAYRWMGEKAIKYPNLAKAIRVAVPFVSGAIGAGVDLGLSYGIPRESLAVTIPTFSTIGEIIRSRIANGIRIEQLKVNDTKTQKQLGEAREYVNLLKLQNDELRSAAGEGQLRDQIKAIAEEGKGTLQGEAKSTLNQWDAVIRIAGALTERYEHQLEKDPYDYQEQLGEGSQAIVRKALNRLLDRVEVLKILRSEYRDNDQMVGRFMLEGQKLAVISKNLLRLNHPGVPEVYRIDRNLDGLPYIAMEYIRGESLAAKLSKLGRIPLSKAARIILYLAKTFKVIHWQKLVHRDIKPENILIEDETGIPKIIDFGIVKDIAKDAGLTKVGGSIFGTPEYLSPEQIRGEELDIRSDIYSLGVTFYQILCGKPPHELPEGDMSIVFGKFSVEVLTTPAPDIRPRVGNIPEGIANLLMRMLSKNREERPGHDEIIVELQKYTPEGRRAAARAENSVTNNGIKEEE